MLMDIGLLVLEPGDTYVIEEPEKETAVLLFESTNDIPAVILVVSAYTELDAE